MRKIIAYSIIYFQYTVLIIMLCPVSKNMYATEKNLDKLIQSLEESYTRVNDYTCKFYKKVFINGEYCENDNIITKFKKPNNYYMKWTEGDKKGTEVIYAGKKYNNNLRVHPGGIISFIDLEIDPKGSIAMKENLHSIYESDIGFIISLINRNYYKAKKNSEGNTLFVKDTILDGRNMQIYKAVFPKEKDYYCHIIYVYIDINLNLPVMLIAYDKNNKMFEKYYYKDLKVNVGLKDIDFDADNPEYEY